MPFIPPVACVVGLRSAAQAMHHLRGSEACHVMGPSKPCRRASARSLCSSRRREARLRTTCALYHGCNPPSRAAPSPPLA
eukprot:CAMPEP_0172607444 /NCGR_PEP_ID=MMETSP1068-20121228/27632_1 /TAXON_ID=35684 /ORGANISM="Pseudopedinella elastica, Strain CCMP716" /LENGTH=79 /DNA_ID=CAMNT_0013410457 /DNA_START=30 /DNA_END=266 /DNA_ORIENTATION=+